MADQYHINPESGQVSRCFARLGPCPFGSSAEHFDSAEAGRAAYEASQREELFASTLRKKPPAYGRVLVSHERLKELQEEGYSFSTEGEVSRTNVTDWKEAVTVTSTPGKGPQIQVRDSHHRFQLETASPGKKVLTFDTWQGMLTSREAQSYAEDLDYSRKVARDAIAAAEAAEAVRREVFGSAPDDEPAYEIEKLPRFEPTPFPYTPYEVQRDRNGIVVEELRANPGEPGGHATVLVDDNPREGLHLRIKPDYRGYLTDEQLQHHVYSLRRAFITSREVEDIHMTRR